LSKPNLTKLKFLVYPLSVDFSSGVDPTLPIPNRVLKRTNADDTWMQIQGKVGQSQHSIDHPLKGWFLFFKKVITTNKKPNSNQRVKTKT